MSAPELQVRVGGVTLANPVLAASGCFGTGAELLGTVDAATLGAVVTKSMSASPWEGNPAPRLVPATGGGMLNSVGLQNPGVAHWRERELPQLVDAGVRVVASVWGRSVDDFAAAASALGEAAGSLVAVEANVSCPNLEAAGEMFAHHPDQAAEAVAAVVDAVGDTPVWAKLSPNLPSVVPIAEAVASAGAAAVVLVNTLIGMRIDLASRRPALGNVTGGLSGPPLHPVAVRCVWETHAALPGLPIVGVGGVVGPEDAVELMLAGASAVEVGAAHFADPGAGVKIVRGLRRWCRRNGVASVADLIGAAHAR